MPKSKKELQAQVDAFKRDLTKYEGLLAKSKKDGVKRDQVHYAMTVAGLKNSIKEIETQLRKM